MTYDSGEYQKAMDWVLEVGDWKGFPARARKRDARQAPRHRASPTT